MRNLRLPPDEKKNYPQQQQKWNWWWIAADVNRFQLFVYQLAVCCVCCCCHCKAEMRKSTISMPTQETIELGKIGNLRALWELSHYNEHIEIIVQKSFSIIKERENWSFLLSFSSGGATSVRLVSMMAEQCRRQSLNYSLEKKVSHYKANFDEEESLKSSFLPFSWMSKSCPILNSIGYEFFKEIPSLATNDDDDDLKHNYWRLLFFLSCRLELRFLPPAVHSLRIVCSFNGGMRKERRRNSIEQEEKWEEKGKISMKSHKVYFSYRSRFFQQIFLSFLFLLFFSSTNTWEESSFETS